MNYADPRLIILRRIGQRLGVLRPVVRMWRKLRNSAYEEAFDTYTIERVTRGSTVWDVGANTGFFTEKYADAVEDNGKVLAFDPSPSCIKILEGKFLNKKIVQIVPIGLSDHDGVESFSYGEEADPTGALGSTNAGEHSVSVRITTGDLFLSENASAVPNFIKIDVEGFELDVLLGMSNVLKSESLVGVFVEVHFLESAKRGLKNAPTKIVSLLENSGFEVKWIDPSHLVAERDV